MPRAPVGSHKSDAGAKDTARELPGKVACEVLLGAPEATGAESGDLRPLVAKTRPGGWFGFDFGDRPSLSGRQT